MGNPQNTLFDAVIQLVMPLLTQDRRKGLLTAAFGNDERVLAGIDFTGANDTFAPTLVRQLVLFGEIAPGQSALVTLLESLASGLGVDQQKLFNEVIARVKAGPEAEALVTHFCKGSQTVTQTGTASTSAHAETGRDSWTSYIRGALAIAGRIVIVIVLLIAQFYGVVYCVWALWLTKDAEGNPSIITSPSVSEEHPSLSVLGSFAAPILCFVAAGYLTYLLWRYRCQVRWENGALVVSLIAILLATGGRLLIWAVGSYSDDRISSPGRWGNFGLFMSIIPAVAAILEALTQ